MVPSRRCLAENVDLLNGMPPTAAVRAARVAAIASRGGAEVIVFGVDHERGPRSIEDSAHRRRVTAGRRRVTDPQLPWRSSRRHRPPRHHGCGDGAQAPPAPRADQPAAHARIRALRWCCPALATHSQPHLQTASHGPLGRTVVTTARDLPQEQVGRPAPTAAERSAALGGGGERAIDFPADGK